ncbi:MAG: response regulator, partial [Lachnospiraceae bacterium]|nr:response regulator [Lachnospiraceae bacterium]
MSDKHHVMIVDDDAILTKSIEYMLNQRGFIVSTANSGNEALTLLKGGLDPDIILLDVNMPNMDGYQTFEAIERIKFFPIIFVT